MQALLLNLTQSLTMSLMLLTTLPLVTEPLPVAGEMVRDFSLAAQDGNTVRLQDLRGQWVALYFCPMNEAPECPALAESMQKEVAALTPQHVVVVGISGDHIDTNGNFSVAHHITFRLLADPDKQVAARWGSVREMWGFRQISRNAFLISPDGKVARVWTGVNGAQLSADLLTALAIGSQ